MAGIEVRGAGLGITRSFHSLVIPLGGGTRTKGDKCLKALFYLFSGDYKQVFFARAK